MLQAEILDLKTNFESKATGVVLESKIDIGRGPVVTTIITSGTLKKEIILLAVSNGEKLEH